MALVDDLTGHFADHEESVLYVNHGATAGTARPTLGSNSTAAASVVWVGSVEPTNATTADQWYDTSNEVWKHKASGSFVTVGNGASQAVVKDTDETRTATTTLAADAELTKAVEANTDYTFEMFLRVVSPAAADFKMEPVGPSGSTVKYAIISNQGPTISNAQTGSVGIPTSGAADAIRVQGTVVVGGTAGSLELQWSQVTSNVGNTTVSAGSAMTLTKES